MSKFQRSKGGFSSNWGTFQVKFQGKKVGCCPILEDGTVLTDNEHVIVVLKDDVPDTLFEGKHKLRLSENKKTILSFKPINGQYPTRFVEFSHKEGQPPMPKSKQSSFNDDEEYEVFTALYEITDGQYKGCIVSQELVYRFEPNLTVNPPVAKFKGYKGTRLDQLEEFLDVVIGEFDPPQWPNSNNILPFLQKLALNRSKKIALIMKDGWIKTLIELDQPTKKSNKKADSKPPWNPDDERIYLPDAE